MIESHLNRRDFYKVVVPEVASHNNRVEIWDGLPEWLIEHMKPREHDSLGSDFNVEDCLRIVLQEYKSN